MKFIERAKSILLKPSDAWQVIDRESVSAGGLYMGYALPLAAIGPVATFIGMSLIGMPSPFTGTTFRVPVGAAITQAVVTYGLTLAGVFLVALIINALAPTFGGTKNATQALKVSVYGSTAAWLAGIFSLVPALSILGLLGLYSIYLLYVGLPIVMKAPREKAIGYTVVVGISAIVGSVVIGAVAGSLVTTPGAGFSVPPSR
jgi:hypothetical protein